ncbi:MAG: hypothetical protein Kow0069_36360 [Promethearchaeota archaeon]
MGDASENGSSSKMESCHPDEASDENASVQRVGDSSKAVDKGEETEQLWRTVGYHRIVGGFFYSYVLLIGGAVIGLITVSAILPLFLPYPDIEGYKNITAGLLGFWFGVFDFQLGGGGSLSDGMSRFIGQYADTDPLRACKYIQFYIWWQMFTGIVQVTIIGAIAYFRLVHTDLAYLAYFIIAQSFVQYPGMLMIMEASLKSFQRGDKLAWLSWLQDTVFQFSVNIVCLLIGKWWGANNPQIGELVGITIFWILAQFLDDWINLFVGSWMFKKVLEPHGVTLGDVIRPSFDREVVLESLKFTGKQWVGNQILGFFGWLIGLYIVLQMPGVAAWRGLMLIPNFVGHLVTMQGPMMSQAVPAFSESYNNGKKELCRYFVHDSLKYYGFVTIFMATSMVVLTPTILSRVVEVFPSMRNYTPGIVMIPVVLVTSMFSPLFGLWGKIFIACDDPMPPIYVSYVMTLPGYGFQFLFIHLCITTNVLPTWYILIFPNFLSSLFSALIGFAWLQRRVIRIGYKELAWQAFVAPVLTALAFAGILWLLTVTLWPALDGLFVAVTGVREVGVIMSALFFLLGMLFFFPALFFCPILALFGGWDDFTLEEFRKAAVISGPSKGLTMLLYWMTEKFAKVSPLHGRFPIADYSTVETQIRELVEEGRAVKLLKL